jgi:hypothetical protein
MKRSFNTIVSYPCTKNFTYAAGGWQSTPDEAEEAKKSLRGGPSIPVVG